MQHIILIKLLCRVQMSYLDALKFLILSRLCILSHLLNLGSRSDVWSWVVTVHVWMVHVLATHWGVHGSAVGLKVAVHSVVIAIVVPIMMIHLILVRPEVKICVSIFRLENRIFSLKFFEQLVRMSYYLVLDIAVLH